MYIIVIGAGEVGFDVARQLSREQHEVTVVDIDPDKLARVRERLDVLTVQGSGTSADVLEEAGIRRADLLLAVTSIDEVNLISCMMAHRLGVPIKIARVRSGEFTRLNPVLRAEDLGIDLLIHPEETTAQEILLLIRRASATDVLSFADGKLQLVGLRVETDAPIINRRLMDFMQENRHLIFRVMVIQRGGRTILPRGDDVFRPRDQVFVLAYTPDLPEVIRLFGKSEARMRYIMILGGTPIGAKTALLLSQMRGMQVKLIEPDRVQAEKLAETLPDILVLNGDPTDIDLLVAEGLGETDAFIAVTRDEESNLVTCLLAKHLGVKKTIAQVSKPGYVPLSQTIGLDAAVNVKLAVSRGILHFLRGRLVESVATIPGIDVEIVELKVEEGAALDGKVVREIRFPRGMLLGAVIRNGSVEIVTGDTRIQAGDRLLVFVLPGRLAEIRKLVEHR